MKKLVSFSVFILLLFTGVSVFACRCISPDIVHAWRSAVLVIDARVDEVVPLPSGEGSSAIVTVISAWKQDTPVRLVINSFTNCAFRWKAGNHYILFLRKEQNGLYSSDRCMGNRLSSDDNARHWLDRHGNKMQVRTLKP